jgi:cytochrome c oxidase cbb3-type subunit 3
LGCNNASSAESLPEWTPADHHSTDDDKVTQRAAAPARSAEGNSDSNVAELVDLTWRQQCVTCHGSLGRGDGQLGPMVGAPDLTNSEWQKRTSDAEIAMRIKTGKNKMPRFDLPDAVVDGLVARVRALRQP